jgi:hypothetical protein
MDYRIGQEAETYAGPGTIESIYEQGEFWALHVRIAGGYTVLVYEARTTA